jgi:hypothetical protein
MDNIVFDFQDIWDDIDYQTGGRSATFAKYIRAMGRGVAELDEEFRNIIREIDYREYSSNFSYWYDWRSWNTNMDMWPRLGNNEERKKIAARKILEKFCPIASKYWIKKELLKEEKLRAQSIKRTVELGVALNKLQ